MTNGTFTLSLRAAGAIICTILCLVLLGLDTFAGVEAARSWGLASAIASAVLWIWCIQARAHDETVERVEMMVMMRER